MLVFLQQRPIHILTRKVKHRRMGGFLQDEHVAAVGEV